ncbi:RHS repeat-associated core domain-containing protein [Micromonospora sp. NBC_00617]|uniref:RHS repeat-associated core domain-containing protein n=1 Tax=Micromonospora sp. NBC_00617 TaxID=2903587 RepID=UPI0030E00D54
MIPNRWTNASRCRRRDRLLDRQGRLRARCHFRHTSAAYNGNGQNKPHTLTSTTTTGGTTGTTSYTYDNAGNTTGRNAAQGNQTLTWDEAGDLVAVTGGASGNNSFIYDTDGGLLLQKEPGKNTLYLPGQQLTLNTTSTVVTGNRYYALPGGGSCIRTGSGTAYTFAIADHQGTPSLYLDNTAQNPTWRQYTPYGGARGATVTAPDNHGFLDKPMSPTGLSIVGARAYDPSIGKFASLDPLQDSQQPQQWNGYSYANNTPVTSSDPTGLIPEDCRHFDCYGYDPRPLKDGDGRGAGGCPGGCGTGKNKDWGKEHGKTSTKSKRGKYVPPKPKPEIVKPPSPKKACGGWSWVCSSGDWLVEHRGAILNGAAIVGMGACVFATAGICGGVALAAAGISAGYRGYDFYKSDRTAEDWGKLGIGVATDFALTKIPTAKVRIPGQNKPFRRELAIPLGRVGTKLTGATKLHLSAGRYEQAYRIDPARASYVVAGWSIGTNHDPLTSLYSQYVG